MTVIGGYALLFVWPVIAVLVGILFYLLVAAVIDAIGAFNAD